MAAAGIRSKERAPNSRFEKNEITGASWRVAEMSEGKQQRDPARQAIKTDSRTEGARPTESDG